MPAKPFQAVTSLLDIQLSPTDKISFKKSFEPGADNPSFKESMRKVRDDEQLRARTDREPVRDANSTENGQAKASDTQARRAERNEDVKGRAVDNDQKPEAVRESQPSSETEAATESHSSNQATQSEHAQSEPESTKPAPTETTAKAAAETLSEEGEAVVVQVAEWMFRPLAQTVKGEAVDTASPSNVTVAVAEHTDMAHGSQVSNAVLDTELGQQTDRPLLLAATSQANASQSLSANTHTVQSFPLQPLPGDALSGQAQTLAASNVVVPAPQAAKTSIDQLNNFASQPILEGAIENNDLSAQRQPKAVAAVDADKSAQQNKQAVLQFKPVAAEGGKATSVAQASSEDLADIKPSNHGGLKEAVAAVTQTRNPALDLEKLILDKGLGQVKDGKISAANVESASAVKTAVHSVNEALHPRQISASAHNGKITVQANVQFGHSQWPTAIAERAAWLVSQTIQSAEIQLDPPELGPLSVKIHVQNDQAAVTFVANNAQVKDAVDQSLVRLKEMLQEQGMQLIQADVSDRGQQEKEAGQEGGRSQLAEGHDAQEEQHPVELMVMEINQGIDFYA